MTTSQNPHNPEQVSRREAMRRGALGAAGMIAAGGLNPRLFAAGAEKTPEQKAAEEKAARDAAAKAKAKDKKVQAKSVDDGMSWPNKDISTAAWDPDNGFFRSASFIGDYSGLAVSSAAETSLRTCLKASKR